MGLQSFKSLTVVQTVQKIIESSGCERQNIYKLHSIHYKTSGKRVKCTWFVVQELKLVISLSGPLSSSLYVVIFKAAVETSDALKAETNACKNMVGGFSGPSARSWQLSAVEIHRGEWGMLGAGGDGRGGGVRCISDSQRAVMNGSGITGHQQLGGRWSPDSPWQPAHAGEAFTPLPSPTPPPTC